MTRCLGEEPKRPQCIEYVASLLSEVHGIAPPHLNLLQETQRLLDVCWKAYAAGKMPADFCMNYRNAMLNALRSDPAFRDPAFRKRCSNCKPWWDCTRPPTESTPARCCPASEKGHLIVQRAMLECAFESWRLDSYAQLALVKSRYVASGVNESKLRVIHVTGSKGKGSICRLVESILQGHGLTTGLYSTPPGLCDPRVQFESSCALEFRARYTAMSIRVNGEYLRPNDFSDTGRYHQEHVVAERAKVKGRDFLTALLIFQKENVDVAIIEAVVGGRYDVTNIFRKPMCVGIGLIDLDHRDRLGDTIGEIAAHKAGVIKRDCPTYTVAQQEREAFDQLLLEDRRRNGSNPNLHVCLPRDFGMDLPGKHQYDNAAVALALATTFLEKHRRPDSESLVDSIRDQSRLRKDIHSPKPEFGDVSQSDPLFGSDDAFEYYRQEIRKVSSISHRALETTRLPLRCQWEQVSPGLDVMFDTAHTEKSVRTCLLEWNIRSKSFAQACKRVLLLYVAQRKPYESIISTIVDFFADTTVCSCDEVWSFTPCSDKNSEEKGRAGVLLGALQAGLAEVGVCSVISFKLFDDVAKCLDALLEQASEWGNVYSFTTGSTILARSLAEELVRRELVDVKIFQ